MAKNKRHSKKNKNVADGQQQQSTGCQETQQSDTSLETNIAEAQNKEEMKTTDINNDSEPSRFVESREYPPRRDFGRAGDAPHYYGGRSNREFHRNNTSAYNSKPRKSEPWSTKFQPDKRENTRLSLNETVTERRGQNSRRTESPRGYGRPRYNGRNPEFFVYQDEFKSKRDQEITYIKVSEIEQDLFEMPKEYSLAHCVAEDMNMGSGIAVRFRYDFKRVDELLNQRQKTGGLAILDDGNRYIYYLVTKPISSGKPTYATLFESLQKLKEHVTEHGVEKLAMPRIGCGLDRLQWDNVKYMLEFVFRNVDVEIVVCNLQQIEDPPQVRHKNCRVTNVEYPIQQIEEGTIIIYLSSEDGDISEEMTLLNEKFNFLLEFRVAKKRPGFVIYFTKNENYLLCGCIVNKTKTDLIDFTALQKCFHDIEKANRKYKFEYVGFQAIKDSDTYLNQKIINMLRNTMRGVDVYICWTGELQEMLPKDRSSDYQSRTSTDSSTRDYDSRSSNWRNNSPSKPHGFESNRKFSPVNKWSPVTNDKSHISQSKTEKNGNNDSYWYDESEKSISFKDHRKESNLNPDCSYNNSGSSLNTTDEKSDRSEDNAGSNWDGDHPSSLSWDNPDEKSNIFPNAGDNWDQDNYQSQSSSTGKNQEKSDENVMYTKSLENVQGREQAQQIIPNQRGNTSTRKVRADDDIDDGETFKSEGSETYTQRESNVQTDEQDTFKDVQMHSAKKLKQSQSRFDRKNIKENYFTHVEGTYSTSQNNEKHKDVVQLDDYEIYEQNKLQFNCKDFSGVSEQELNKLPKEYALACYVSEDMSVEKGVLLGSHLCNAIGNLLNQNQKEGGLAFVKDGQNFLYCLVIKHLPFSAPTRRTLFFSLKRMRDHAITRHVKKIVLPKISCEGIFSESEVKCMLGYIFQNRRIDIILTQPQQQVVPQNNKISHVKSALHQVKRKSVITYFASEDGVFSEEMLSLKRKFDFEESFKSRRHRIGDVLRYKENEDYVLYGCVVKKMNNDTINFWELQRCMVRVCELNQQENLSNICIQAVKDDDDTINPKITNILTNTFKDVTITVCWPGDLRFKMPQRKQT